MPQDLGVRVKEFAKIAGDLPENFQAICFELLLKNYLASLGAPTLPPPGKGQTELSDGADHKPAEQDQEDIALPDLHVKARRFLEKQSLTIDHLNNLFYKEGSKILPVYDDLRTTKLSEGQIRITLLQALQNGIETGEFVATVEGVRQECGARKCYDANNFAANFRHKAVLFDFDDYTRETTAVKLSEPGKTELATVIKELQ